MLDSLETVEMSLRTKNRTLGFDKVYVIYTPYRNDRLQYMQKLTEHMGIDVVFVEASTPQSPKVLQYLNRTEVTGNQDLLKESKEEYNLRVISCYFSHKSIMELMVKDNIHSALILEDDVDFELGISDITREMHRTLDKLDWSLVHFGYCYPGWSIKLNSLLSYTSGVLCTNGYSVSLPFATEFVKLDFVGFKPVDYTLGDVCKSMNCLRLVSNEKLVVQLPRTSSNPSTILNTDQLHGETVHISAAKHFGLGL
ncbi:hypothetical protein MP638_005573 [Amoeboaphelidium occidentale]|nr:hypothetical protein MP638_005573 [Amoeboaphelidium occidentale]